MVARLHSELLDAVEEQPNKVEHLVVRVAAVARFHATTSSPNRLASVDEVKQVVHVDGPRLDGPRQRPRRGQ